jgi:hypothetical protein
MELIHTLFVSLRNVLTPETPNESDERYLARAVDHIDLEHRIASQARAQASMALLNIGR